MAEENLKSLFSNAERQRQELESSYNSSSDTYQEDLISAISTYEDCLKLADRISLFSPNETLEDLASADIQYVHYDLSQIHAHTLQDIYSSTIA